MSRRRRKPAPAAWQPKRDYTPPPGIAHVRCRRCGMRRTLPRPLADYGGVRVPRCQGAGCHSRSYRCDTWRVRHEVGRGAPRPCRCPHYHFPHHKGRGMCIHNPNVTEEYAVARGYA